MKSWKDWIYRKTLSEQNEWLCDLAADAFTIFSNLKFVYTDGQRVEKDRWRISRGSWSVSIVNVILAEAKDVQS